MSRWLRATEIIWVVACLIFTSELEAIKGGKRSHGSSDTRYSKGGGRKGSNDVPPGIQAEPMGNAHEIEGYSEVCSIPSPPPFSTIKCEGIYDNGKKCFVRCNQGYVLRDRASVFMTECFPYSNRWMPSLETAICTPDGKGGFEEIKGLCVEPVIGYNMRMKCKTFPDGRMTCEGKCSDGFYFTNTQSTTMTLSCEFGRWLPVGAFPECSWGNTGDRNTDGTGVIDPRAGSSGSCQRPSAGYNTHVKCRQFHDGRMTCEGKCSDGFYFSNTQSTTMTLSCEYGRWLPVDTFPKCISSYPNCSAITPPPNVQMRCTYFGGRSNTNCTGKCFYGRFPDGSSEKVLICRKGKWENGDNFPTCGTDTGFIDPRAEPSGSCKEPPANNNMRMRCHQNYDGKKTCVGSCDDEFHFSNTQSKTMLLSCESGRWSPVNAFPECISSYPNCSAIDPPPNVQMRCTYFGSRSNKNCTGKCFYGRFPDGSSVMVLTCRKGKWENGDNFPTCEIDMCDVPPDPTNGQSTCEKTSTEKICTASCNPKYGFEYGLSNEIIKCALSDGRWYPKSSFSNCKRICQPACRNGGHCTRTGMCVCPESYRGAQCQYSLKNCDERNVKFPGTVACTHLSNASMCELKCEEGFYLDASTNIITCDLQGNFSPKILPKCKRMSSYVSGSTDGDWETLNQEHVEDEYGGKTLPSQFVLASSVSTGVCAVWSTYHYRTFDGYIYDYAGSCSYVLVKDVLTNLFSITLEHDKNCVNRRIKSGTKCYRTVKITLADEVFRLYAGPNGVVLTQNEKHLPIPYTQRITVEYIARYTVATLYQDTTVWIDGMDAIYIVVSKQFKAGLQGLCGNYDDNHNNDVMKPDGALVNNVIIFGNSWKVEEARVCEDVVENAYSGACRHDSSEDDKIAERAAARCLNINEYKYCHQFVRPEIYIQACKMDCCDQRAQDGCECSSFAEYFRECARLNTDKYTAWRKPALCPMKCENGTEYQDCGSACPKTCGAPDIPCQIKACVDGCHCSDGMALHEGQCLPLSECPCQHNDHWYAYGTSLEINCRKCLCQSGSWECTENICPAICSSVGDSHFTTFDGKRYNFVGHCSYYLVHQDDGYMIEQENSDCVSNAGEYELAIHKKSITSCKKTVILKTPQGTTIKLKHGMEISVNGKEVMSLPHLAPGVSIRQLTSIYQEAEFSNGLKILWDGWNRIYVVAPVTLFGKVQGLCGTFNNFQNDDFITPAGDQEKSVKFFAEKWKVPNGCHDILSQDVMVSSPCDYYGRFQKEAENICSKIKSQVFKDCKVVVDPEPFYKNCMYDVCSCKSEISSCFCSSLADYALVCARNNVSVDWRPHVPNCALHCIGRQQYQTYHKSCEYSCHQIAMLPECEAEYVEGCACPSGEALDTNGNCVPITECPCIYHNHEYPPNFVQRRGTKTCTCMRGQWQCRTSSLEELMTTPPSDVLYCLAAEHKEYTDCMSDCPLTCSNLHDPPSCTMLSCRSGCRCQKGYILNENNGDCVLPKDCPCHHGMRSYKDKEKIHIDCKECICKKGYWECDKDDCPGVCSAWGNSHFITFDGHFYDFQGTCEYVLASGKINNKDTFSIIIQNEKCGSNGITCSKSISFSIGDDLITLSRNGPFPRVNPDSRFSIKEVGMFIYISTNIGISLQWDKGTRVYVHALPTWSGKLKGLCGDFNGDSIDDFKQPSGNIPATRAVDFANSWKMHSYCQKPLDIPETCVFHSERREWALEKCKILKSATFSECHSEVDLEPYYESCVFDACACDMGGDCECLCTAIAAYASECARNGIFIYWRSQELCPIQCEDCDHYSPCISTCPLETCETEGMDVQEKACQEEPCSEGCERNACPTGQIYNNTKDYKCIPIEECGIYEPPSTCEHKGHRYMEGERIDDPEISDECRTCYCTRKGILCSGHACVTPTYEETVTPEKQCVSGWSIWLNVSSPNFKEIYHSLCPEYEVTDIECRPKDDECVFEDMLACLKEDYQNSPFCYKYEIRVYCDCGDYEEPSGGRTEEPPYEVLPGVCGLPMFTDWMTVDSTKINTFQELVSKLRENYSFCDDKDILSVECDVSQKGGITHRNKKGNIKNCFNPKGTLICGPNGRYKKSCKFRILCNCMVKDFQLPNVKCLEETPWINFDKPDDGIDFESLHRIPAIIKLCPKITATRCRELPSNSSRPPPRSPNNIQCVGGEVACKTDSKHTCGDYAIKSNCKCKPKLSPKVTQPSTSSRTTLPTSACPPGSLWDECAINCESTCEPFRKQLSSKGECTDQSNCVAGCRKFDCISPRLWRDDQTCVLEHECPCITETGETLGPNHVVKRNCTTCQCLNGKLSCVLIPDCEFEAEKKPQENYTGESVIQGDCWTKWLNSDSPSTGAGDFEKLSTLRQTFKFCSHPIEVQCRDAITKRDAKDSNEDVTCDKTKGLSCWNKRTLCSDYEIRFFCPCPGITSSPKPETTPIFPQACQQGWSIWYNSYVADDVGDHDNLQLVEENVGGKICVNGAITSVQCRRKRDGISYHLTNHYVTCDVEKGLSCDNSKQNKGERCDDYEIAFFCDCFDKSTAGTTPPSGYSFSSTSTSSITEEGVKVTGIGGIGYTTPVPAIMPACAEFIPLINGETKLPDSNLKATSRRSAEYDAPSIRIPPVSNRRAWIPATVNKNQYLEIDLSEPRLIYGIITQGRGDYQEWVTSYYLSYSNDGLLFTEYQDPRNMEKVISGNYDSENLVKIILDAPFEARYIRLQPNTWEGQIALRVELLGCSKTVSGAEQKKYICLEPMGLENGKLSDAQMTASSYFDWSHTASDARIDSDGWVAGNADSKQYLEIDFLESRVVSAIITQGRTQEDQWVSAFLVSYSNDGNTWTVISDEHENTLKIFSGNYDAEHLVTNYFPHNLRTRYLKITPVQWKNWISMKLEILGCYHEYPEIITSTIGEIIYASPREKEIPYCLEPMGLSFPAVNTEKAIPDNLITVSSSMRGADSSRLRLNTKAEGTKKGGWIPKPSDKNPSVQIDFLTPSVLRAVTTKGIEGTNRWVDSYKISVSNDTEYWQSVYSDGSNIFKGNTDDTNEANNMFDTPVKARYFKLEVILSENSLPGLRMEVFGCYHINETLATTPVPPTGGVEEEETCISYGPWKSLSDPYKPYSKGDFESIKEIIAESNTCSNPIDIECRTYASRMDYKNTKQNVTCDLTHGLSCWNKYQKNGNCYNYEVRIKCWTCKVEVNENVVPSGPLLCPELPEHLAKKCSVCPSNLLCNGKNCIDKSECPCFSGNKIFLAGYKITTESCEECQCAFGGHSLCYNKSCDPCPLEQRPKLLPNCSCTCESCNQGERMCPTSKLCISEAQWCDGIQDCPDDEINCLITSSPPDVITSPPLENGTCELLGNRIRTVDGQELDYEVCDHVMFLDALNRNFNVTVKKICTQNPPTCHNIYLIQHDETSVTIDDDVKVMINGNNYTTSQLAVFNKRDSNIVVEIVGNHVYVTSKVYGFTVIRDQRANLKVEMSAELKNRTIGLCGLYNGQASDDKKKPDGTVAITSKEFGDSWAVNGTNECTSSNCSKDFGEKAVEICNKLRLDPFDVCKDYLNVESYVQACVSSTCECMMEDENKISECKCAAFLPLLEACENKLHHPLSKWRSMHGCAPHCSPGFVWEDCGTGCQLTCDGINMQEQGRICPETCIPGCFCPAGTVLDGTKCVSPEECSNAQCHGFGDPHFSTFDGWYYPFQVAGQFVLATDTKNTFSIEGKSGKCSPGGNGTCLSALTVNYRNNVVNIVKGKPITVNNKVITMDMLPLELNGITVLGFPGQVYLVIIPSLNIVVRYYEVNDGFSINIPPERFQNKTRGLCGNCNGKKDDEMIPAYKMVMKSVSDFVCSWIKGGSFSQCKKSFREKSIVNVQDSCPELLESTFSSCHPLVDPELYQQSCQYDVASSTDRHDAICKSLMEYARQCCEAGVALYDWFIKYNCVMPCPNGTVYHHCHDACPQTCQNNSENVDCHDLKVDGCFCPDKMVLKDGSCVDEIYCKLPEECSYTAEFVIDETGNEFIIPQDNQKPAQYKIGETWMDGLCRNCICKENNGQVIPLCIDTKCPNYENSAEYADYVLVTNYIPGKCCPEILHVDCKDEDGKIRNIGERWQNKTNPCKQFVCASSLSGAALKISKDVKCECKEYEEPLPPAKNKCCGECVKKHCIFENKLYSVGDQWKIGCYIGECIEENGEVTETLQKNCSAIPDSCPMEDRIWDEDHCCEICNATLGAIGCNTVQKDFKIGEFEEVIEGHGKCTNTKPLDAIAKCSGICKSESMYYLENGEPASLCKCCSPVDILISDVELECEDGSYQTFKLKHPKSCKCSPCAASSKGGLKTGPSGKTGSRTQQYDKYSPGQNEQQGGYQESNLYGRTQGEDFDEDI